MGTLTQNCVVGQNLWLCLWTVAVGIQFKQVNRVIHVLNFGSILCSVSPKSSVQNTQIVDEGLQYNWKVLIVDTTRLWAESSHSTLSTCNLGA